MGKFGDSLAAVHNHTRKGEDGTMEGRDPRTGYKEKSVGKVLYDHMPVHIASARQGNSTLWFSLPGVVKVRSLQGGSKGGVLGNQQLHISVSQSVPKTQVLRDGKEIKRMILQDRLNTSMHLPACLTR